jgi:hypothetical protein
MAPKRLQAGDYGGAATVLDQLIQKLHMGNDEGRPGIPRLGSTRPEGIHTTCHMYYQIYGETIVSGDITAASLDPPTGGCKNTVSRDQPRGRYIKCCDSRRIERRIYKCRESRRIKRWIYKCRKSRPTERHSIHLPLETRRWAVFQHCVQISG